MTKKTFIQGAAVLAVAGLIIKGLGAIFRIPLGNMISDTGMGYFQTAYTVYVLLLTVSNSGIPIAISRMVSERIAVGMPAEAHRVFRVSFTLMFCMSAVSFCICFFGAEMIIGLFPKMSEAVHALRAVSPALLFVPVMASYRGYFQGMQDMRPTATSQIMEQFFRVLTGLILAWVLLPRGESFAAAGAAFGTTAGAIGGLIVIMLIYMARKKSIHRRLDLESEAVRESASRILLQIFVIAIPITIGAAIMPIMNTIDLAIVTRRLAAAGFGEETIKLFGQLAGFANPLINLPQVLTQAVAMSLVPAVAGAWKQKDMPFLQHNVRLGLRTAIMVGLPCALGMMTLSRQIMLLFFPLEKEAATSAASCLFILAFGIIFLSTIQTLTGVLQGVGHQMIPVRNLFIGAVAKIIVTWYATGLLHVNVRGAALGTVTAYIVAATLNLLAVRKYTGTHFDIMLTYVKPGLSALVMSGAARVSYGVLHLFLGNALSTIGAVGIGAIVYIVMIFVTKSITEEELAQIPKGERLLRLLRRVRRGPQQQ